MFREMKNSGIEWIGEIPKEWEVVRTKNIYSNTKSIVGAKADTYERLALTLNGVIRRSKDDLNGLQPEKFEGYQILKENELVFKLIDLENIATSRVGISSYTGLVSPAYIILHNDKHSKFGYYYFISMYYQQIFNKLGGDGVRSNLNAKDLLNIPYLNIMEEERTSICNYLDTKVSQIDDIISKQKILIEKYKAYKQSLITETVTKGLNKNVPMKDSGIEWIGEIPSHWTVCKMKNIGESIIGLTYSPDDVSDNGILVLRSSNVQNGEIVYGDDVFVNKNISEKLTTKIGDILICSRNGSRALIGKCAYIDEMSAGKSFGAFMTVFRSEYNRFIYYILNSAIFKFHIGTFLTSTINQLTTSNLSGIRITLPPKDEQQEIVNLLDRKCKSIDSAISKKEQLIEKLESYKKSLIYECVTGKRGVN